MLRVPCCMLTSAFLLSGDADAVAAQGCVVPDSIRADNVDSVRTVGPYSVLGIGGASFSEVALGIGHIHYSSDNPVSDGPPGEFNWLARVELPLSESPGAEPDTWIASGWIIKPGRPRVALSMEAMVETGYEEPSFVVLESRAEDWFRIRYAPGDADEGTAWIPRCALKAGPIRLDYSSWSDWLLSDQISPLFFRVPTPEVLRSLPSSGSASVARITSGYILIPMEVRGDWMRVELRRPSDYCAPDVIPTIHEGWVRWYAGDIGPRVWYFTRGC
jgi:hypothetical protein